MALSDCAKCWDTPCTCGWEYREYNQEYMVKFIKGILRYQPNAMSILEQVIIEKVKEQGGPDEKVHSMG